MTPLEILRQLNELDERPRIEAKAGSDMGKSILETVCAFSNEPGMGGGWLLLGAAPDEQAFWPQYEVIGEDLAVFYGDRSSQSLDATVIPDAVMQEIDPAGIAEYRRLRADISPGAEELTWDDADLLRALRCADFDSIGTLRPTISGILLFGTPIALRRHFPMVRVDYIRVPGRQWVEDPDRRFETIELRAPLIRLVGRAINSILDDLPKAFSLPENAIRREDLPLIPTRVLREAVVNAVMHRSYRIHSPVQIIRYSNRLEIRNPGYSLVSEERWGDPGSVTRNPHLASVLHEINFAETKGSGIRVMRELMRLSNLTAPTLESDRQKDLFVATFLFHHFLGPDDWEWLNSLKLQGLGDEEARALVFVRETLSIDNAAYRDLNQVDVLNASTHLRRLRDQGLLEQRGKGSATYYIPTPRFLATLPGQKAEGEPMPGKKPLQLPPGTILDSAGTILDNDTTIPLSDPSGGKSSKHRPLSGKSDPLSGKQEPLSGKLDTLPALPADLTAVLGTLKARMDSGTLQEITCHLCAWQPLSAEQLAALLKRNRKYVQDRLLTPLLREHRLVPTIPDQPKHPRQAYRASGKGGAA